jgi:hypothetical protein
MDTDRALLITLCILQITLAILSTYFLLKQREKSAFSKEKADLLSQMAEQIEKVKT